MSRTGEVACGGKYGAWHVSRVVVAAHLRRAGPAGIAFRSGDQVLSGDFRIEATFAQFGAPVGYREAYGIFVGGRDLESPDQEYTYLLVRPTGAESPDR